MNIAIYAFIFVILFKLIFQNEQQAAAYHMSKKNRMKRRIEMSGIVKEYIGKDCIIYTLQGAAAIDGVVEDVSDGWITVRGFESKELQAVNLEYVTRIREYPKDKNGKRKAVFF